MLYTTLPTTDIQISRTCLGTMSFGAHVSEDTACAIMDAALDHGITFFDTAEMYSVPTRPETTGLTEQMIGRWMQKNNTRNKIILATKIAGPSTNPNSRYLRDGQNHFDKKNITLAIEGSLKRLQTDSIDYYQLHWPDRVTNIFGQRTFIPDLTEYRTPFEDTLTVLQELQKAGKIRHLGISNETPWGAMEYLRLAKEHGYPRPLTTQNNYSLLTRTFESTLAEVSYRENLGLLGYSPLAYGVLSGRYIDGQRPAGGRLTTYPDFNPRYRTPLVESLVKRYLALAEQHSLTLPQLALAFAYSRRFMTSVIIGPSTVDQLIEDAEAVHIQLTSEVLTAIDTIHESCPNPCA